MAPLPVKPAAPAAPGAAVVADARGDAMAQQFRVRMQIAENLRRIKRQVIVMSGKGGVGKSTVAVNLAAAFADEGMRVGLLDLDLTNPNDPHMLGVGDMRPQGTPEGRIKPVAVRTAGGGSGAAAAGRGGAAGEPLGGSPDGTLLVMSTAFFTEGRKEAIIWRGPIKMKMIQDLLGQVDWGDLDVLVVDLPPGTGDEPLSVAQLLKDADGAVVVTTPQGVALLDVRKSIQFAGTMGLRVLGVVENMGRFVCPHCHHGTDVFGEGGGALVADESKVPLLARIPLEPGVALAGESGTPYVWRGGDSETAKAFRALAANVKAQFVARASGPRETQG